MQGTNGSSGRGRRSRSVTVTPIPDGALVAAKPSFTSRHVPAHAMRTLIRGAVRPRAGSLVLARVARIGSHQKLELTTGRRALLHLGDEIIAVYADRYAPDQFEAEVPMDLGPAQLVAAGGVVSSVVTKSDAMRRATDVTPVGLIGDEFGIPLSLADFAVPLRENGELRPPAVAVVGTSMNSGKTTVVHSLVVGTRAAGHVPGVTKVTGTGSGGDYWVMLDAGARMLDFTDAGLASTYRVDNGIIERTMAKLVDDLAGHGCDAVLIEIADGLYQQETAHLIESPGFRERIGGVIFAAADSMGAVAGVVRLRSLEIPVIGISGRVTRSPLAIKEIVGSCDVPVFGREELQNAGIAASLLGLRAPDAEASSAIPSSVADLEPVPSIVDLTDFEELAEAISTSRER